MTAPQTTTGPESRTTIWRCVWREEQDEGPPRVREAWVDDEGEAWEHKAKVERQGRCVGKPVVYQVDVYDEGETAA